MPGKDVLQGLCFESVLAEASGLRIAMKWCLNLQQMQCPCLRKDRAREQLQKQS